MNLFRNEISKEGVIYIAIATLMLVATFYFDAFPVLLNFIPWLFILFLFYVFYRIQVRVNMMIEIRDNLEKAFVGELHRKVIQTTIADLLVKEPPQTIATILSHLVPDMAASILKLLPERLHGDVILRIATLDKVQPVDLRSLEEILKPILAIHSSGLKSCLGGASTAADILSLMDRTQDAALESVRDHDPALAQKIMDNMFIFEDLIDIEDRDIQRILREVQSESIIVALKGASEELRSKIFKNMSQREAEILREGLEKRGPVKLSEVEFEQQKILKIARRLADEGSIGSGEVEAYV